MKLYSIIFYFMQVSCRVVEPLPITFSHEQYGSKLAFAIRDALSVIFLFCFFFSLFKASPKAVWA